MACKLNIVDHIDSWWYVQPVKALSMIKPACGPRQSPIWCQSREADLDAMKEDMELIQAGFP